jgi:hypothetical protein
MKKILFLILFPLFSFAQDTIIIKKVFIDPDTVWQVKQITDADNSSLTVFADSNLIIPFLTNDLVDDARKMADALNLLEKQNKFSLRIKIGESLNRPLVIISDTYGYILNYPNQGDRMVIYLTKANVFKDFDNKLILRKAK